jgi:hypothetical protein
MCSLLPGKLSNLAHGDRTVSVCCIHCSVPSLRTVGKEAACKVWGARHISPHIAPYRNVKESDVSFRSDRISFLCVRNCDSAGIQITEPIKSRQSCRIWTRLHDKCIQRRCNDIILLSFRWIATLSKSRRCSVAGKDVQWTRNWNELASMYLRLIEAFTWKNWGKPWESSQLEHPAHRSPVSIQILPPLSSDIVWSRK